MSEREQIVAWLREQAQLCDCFAHGPNECACGAWWGDNERTEKTMQIEDIADAIERGDFIKDKNDG